MLYTKEIARNDMILINKLFDSDYKKDITDIKILIERNKSLINSQVENLKSEMKHLEEMLERYDYYLETFKTN